MMLDHLDRHPKIYGFRLETHILPLYVKRVARYGDLQDNENFRKLWNDMRHEYAFVKANRREVLQLPDNWADVPRSVPGVFNEIMRIFSSRENKSRWCEKTPMHVFYIEELADLFPGSRFIHMIRDGRDCAASCWRRWGAHPVGAAVRWRNAINAARSASPAISGRYLEVVYEQVTAEPERVLREVCKFLDEDFTERLLEANRVRPNVTGHSSATISANRRTRSTLFEKRYAERIELIAGKVLNDCGYDCRHPKSAVDHGVWDRLGWWTTDARGFLMRMIRGKASGQRRLSWRLFWSRIVTTAKVKMGNKIQ